MPNYIRVGCKFIYCHCREYGEGKNILVIAVENEIILEDVQLCSDFLNILHINNVRRMFAVKYCSKIIAINLHN